MSSPHPVSAPEALARLREGNSRFMKNVRSIEVLASQSNREALVRGQAPYAMVLSCSDSRAPSELIFDCGLGDLFVVRVAGNIVAPSIIGSIEYAAATFGTELLVVMGHSGCGAVTATVQALTEQAAALSPDIEGIIRRIEPAVSELTHHLSGAELLQAAVRANVRASAGELRHGSRILEERVRSGRLRVVGAEYLLATGEVDFFDLPPSLA